MSWHPTDEDLILHFYGEDAGEESRLDAHLDGCSTCRSAWTELGETLKLVDAARVPEPDPGFERVLWARVQAELPAPRTATASWWSLRGLLPLAAGAAVIAVAVTVASRWEQTPPVPPASTQAVVLPVKPGSEARARERVLLSALNEHFEQTQMLLVELMNAPTEGQGELAFERAAADDLVSSGRLYRMTAEQSGDLQFAQMLEDIESVLVDIARSPARLNRKEIQSLRARIDGEDLLFKVRAVTSVIHVRQKDLMSSDE